MLKKSQHDNDIPKGFNLIMDYGFLLTRYATIKIHSPQKEERFLKKFISLPISSVEILTNLTPVRQSPQSFPR